MTMLAFAIFFGVVVFACSAVQNHCTAGLLRCFDGELQPTSDSETCAQRDIVELQTVVILCLRGSDPQLEDCLKGLLKQDYDKWELRIVVDHINDPALEVVQACLSREPCANVSVQVLETRYETCSLKLSALSQELARLDETCEAVVLVDADVMTYPGWLRDMLKPLEDQSVGAATGIRWFAPPGKSVGASMRYLWNLGAIGQMHQFGIAWGGSLALKADFVRSAELSRQWSQMAFEDTALLSSLTRAGLQLRFVPQATMVNTEPIKVADCMSFIQRQMLNVRLYHPAWKSIFAFGFLSAIGTTGSLVMLFETLLTQNWTALVALAGLLGLAGLTSAFFAVRIETSIRRTLKTRLNQPIGSFLLSSMIYVVPIQLLYGFTLPTVLKQKTVDWRGIRYHIDRSSGTCKVTMGEYQPMTAALKPLSSIV